MKNRRRNNIIIGTLCCVLVLMGVGYAILSTTLNIGATAKITGDFDIHFTNIQRSSSTISDSSILSTIDAGTGITANTNSHAGTFTAVLQKPTDYVIYTVSVANTGSIDGYLTFSFEDTNSNFDYYKDFYSVEFIRDDVDPDISTDILQPNATFTDSEVLENTTGTRTYKIKVMFKESASGFPDATTNGAFECTLNLTYSQQAPNGGNSGGNTESNLTWYSTVLEEFGGVIVAYGVDQSSNERYYSQYLIEAGDIVPFIDEKLVFVPYTSSVVIQHNYMGIIPQEGDYVLIDDSNSNDSYLQAIIRGTSLYIVFSGDENADVFTFTLDPTGSLEKYTSNGGNNQQQNNLTWYYTDSPSADYMAAAIDSEYNLKYFLNINKSTGEVTANVTPEMNVSLIEYESPQQYAANLLSVTPQVGDYFMGVNVPQAGGFVLSLLLHDGAVYAYYGTDNTDYQMNVDSTGSYEKYTS